LPVDFSGPLTQEPLSVNVWLLVRRGAGRQGWTANRAVDHAAWLLESFRGSRKLSERRLPSM